jgi:hypothetical protein
MFFVDSNIGSSPQNLHGHNLKKKRSPFNAYEQDYAMGFHIHAIKKFGLLKAIKC